MRSTEAIGRTNKRGARHQQAEIVREYGPFPGVERVHGVTFDGDRVWFAGGEKLAAIDPASGCASSPSRPTATAKRRPRDGGGD